MIYSVDLLYSRWRFSRFHESYVSTTLPDYVQHLFGWPQR